MTAYTYNDLGLVETTSVLDGTQAYTVTTSYDKMGRAKTVTDAEGGTTTYQYDCAGNVTKRTDPGGAVTVYEYDKN